MGGPEPTGKPADNGTLDDIVPITKLVPPRSARATLGRKPLLARLRQAVETRPLTLVSAPAGYGKTTLLAELKRDPSAPPMAWLSIDEDDQDPARFMRAVVAALQRVQPDCGLGALAVLNARTDETVDARRCVRALINDVLETCPDPFVLTLDDLFFIQNAEVLAALELLIDRLPPQMHVLVGTREDPPVGLGRLRARGQLAEFHATDLSFSADEIDELLNTHLGLGLTPMQIGMLVDRTEGWGVELGLLGDLLSQVATSDGRVAFLVSVVHTRDYVFDFLAEEVLHRQTADRQRFLIETSILDELAPSVCRVVSGREDAALLLRDLHRRNVFMTELADPDAALDGAEPRYRYHRSFLDFLRRRLEETLSPEEIAHLHGQAGRIVASPDRATRHLLAAGLEEEATALVEQRGRALLRQGAVTTLRTLLEGLSADAVAKRPDLAYLAGCCALQQQNPGRAATCFEQAVDAYQRDGREQDGAEALARLAETQLLQPPFDSGIELVARSLEIVRQPILRARLLLARARTLVIIGQFDQAAIDFQSATNPGDITHDPEVLRMLLESWSNPLVCLPGGLDGLERLCQQAGRSTEVTESALAVNLDQQWAVVHAYRGRLSEAARAAESAMTLGERLGGMAVWPYWTAAILRAAALAALGEVSEVENLADRALSQPAAPAGGLVSVAQTCWLVGDLPRARALAGRFDQMAQGTPGLPQMWSMMLAGILAIADGRLSEAEEPLTVASRVELALPIFNAIGSATLLLAWVLLKLGRSEAAMELAAGAVGQCERQGAPGRLLLGGHVAAEVLHQLAMTPHPQAARAAEWAALLPGPAKPTPAPPPAANQPIEGLTRRELEVLRLVQAGASNREIAEDLVITERTAKAHVTNILGKLGVSSRARAAARAYDLGMV